MDPIKIYDYLTKAREIVFDAVRALPPQQYKREYSIGMKTLGRTLTHMMIVEWAYMERIKGNSLPPYETWPIQDEKPPGFDVIEKTWRDQARQTRATLQAAHSSPASASGGWMKEFEYVSIRPRDGKKIHITVSPADVFSQMLMHEVHHRAQIMAMMREAGRPLEDLDYAYLMYKRREMD